MTEQPRITVAAIREAQAKTGLKIVRGRFGDGAHCGCPQMILFVAEGNALSKDPQDHDEQVYEWADEKYGMVYAYTFRGGFDRGEKWAVAFQCYKYETGYADGLAAREALIGKGE